MKYHHILILLSNLALAGAVNAQNDISGKLTTPTGEVPYNVETFDAHVQAADGSGDKHTVYFNQDGTFSVLGIPNKIEDEELMKKGKFFDTDGSNASANISGFVDQGLRKQDIKANIIDMNGRTVRSVNNFDYKPETGRLDIKEDMNSNASGHYSAHIIANGKQHTAKFVNNPFNGVGSQTISDNQLENIIESHNQLKAGSALKGNTSTYKLVVDDPFENMRDTTYTITVPDNSSSEFNGVMKYAKNAIKNIAIRRSDGNLVENAPIIFSYNNDPEKRDTIWINSVPQVIEVDLNKVGTNPTYEIVNGFEEANLSNPNIPFKSTTGTTNFDPGNNGDGLFNVESFLEQQITLQLVDLYDTTQVVNNTTVPVRYLDTNTLVNYTPDSEGKIYLDRKAENTSIAIEVDGNNDYLGRREFTKSNGKKIGHMNYQLVTTEDMENRTQKIIMVPKVLETGLEDQPTIEVTASEFIDAYAAVNLQVANGRLDIYVNPNFLASDEEINEYFSYFSERIGVPINRVYENKNPSVAEANTYDYYKNNYNNGDKVFTSTLALGAPVTEYNYSTPSNNIVMYSGNATSTGSKNNDFKEIWRLYGFNQTDYGDASAENGGLTINAKEGAVGRALAKMYQYYAKGTDYTTPEGITSSQ